MKLQKEELAAVATHILEQIKLKHSVGISKEEEKLIDIFVENKNEIEKSVIVLQSKLSVLRTQVLKKLKISSSNIYRTDKQELIDHVKKAKSKPLPSLDKIRSEVILKSLFSDESELKDFIKELVAKY